MSTVAPSPLLAALRQGTAEAHTQLEAEINIPKVCEDAAAYRRLIEGFFGYYEPFEAVLRAFPGWEEKGFSWADRSKIEFLRADLKALGLTESAIAALPRCKELPAPQNLNDAFGCAYVLEGSTLGGRHISGILEKTGIPPEARRFFASYGERVGEQWKAFCAMLAALPLDKAETQSAAAAASDTFATIGRWFKSVR